MRDSLGIVQDLNLVANTTRMKFENLQGAVPGNIRVRFDNLNLNNMRTRVSMFSVPERLSNDGSLYD